MDLDRILLWVGETIRRRCPKDFSNYDDYDTGQKEEVDERKRKEKNVGRGGGEERWMNRTKRKRRMKRMRRRKEEEDEDRRKMASTRLVEI
ncbi:hypothetical protein M0802_015413 [Mischocyttarus mexicanus]|nr:hypothetical protein M0802_015413 [Mischocyttarus mexicanus]